MPRFFFQVSGSPEDLGMDLPDIAAAKCEAVRYAGKLICEEADRFWDKADFTMAITDEAGLVLFSLILSGVDAPVIRVGPQIPA